MKLFMHSLVTAAACTLFTFNAANAQKLKDGSFDAIKGTTQFNVIYEYNNMTVTTKDVPEAEYIAKKKDEYNAKEPGKGDKWAAAWVEDREKRYAVQFKEEFDKQSGISVGNYPDAKYTLIVRTTHTETGYNIGISRRNAYIDCEIWIVETANQSNVIAKISLENMPGGTFGGFDFETGLRLQECYAKAGKEFGKMIRKKL